MTHKHMKAAPVSHELSAHESTANVDIDHAENISANPTLTPSFHDICRRRMNRRGMVRGSLSAAALTHFLAPEALAGSGASWRRGCGLWRAPLIGFQELSIEEGARNATTVKISADYEYQVLIPWGTPIEPDATHAYHGEPDRRPTPEEAALQIGIGHDGMWFFPDTRGLIWSSYRSDKGMLCINHEFGYNPHVLGKGAPDSLQDVRLAQHVLGVSVVAIERDKRGVWQVVSSPHSRRIHVNTPVRFSGPAASSSLLHNPIDHPPLGTMSNCGSGRTLWGTYLTCEENVNGYFGWTDESYTPTPAQARYGFGAEGFGYGWHHFDKRFDLSDPRYANECHRFGWVVEIDPHDQAQVPVKRTALGRFKHEAIAMVETKSGAIACYMGDDQAFDYCYKYVSQRAWKKHMRNGESPLDHGTLYVARFNADGTGEWVELSMDNPVLAKRFGGIDEILVHTRLASDAVRATPMDRPEWTTIGKNGEVYWTLTNNRHRSTAHAANPETPNSHGHIIKTYGDHDHTSFRWDIFVMASDTKGTAGVFSNPDVAWADDEGRLFVGTDGGQSEGLQDQLLVFDSTQKTPQPKRLLVGVAGDEITGFTVTPDYQTAFTNVQHPGRGDPRVTNFPKDFDGKTIPRDCTLVLTRRGGGRIGS